MQHVNHDKCETYNYTQLKQLTVRVRDCSKVKLHALVRPLNFFSSGMDFLSTLGQQITDFSLQTNRPKHLTFKD